jgi:hypothetical protein
MTGNGGAQHIVLESQIVEAAVPAAEPAASEPAVSGKKQVPLRLSAALYGEIAAWAEAEFRSVNGQIEFLLNEAVKRRKKFLHY